MECLKVFFFVVVAHFSAVNQILYASFHVVNLFFQFQERKSIITRNSQLRYEFRALEALTSTPRHTGRSD